MTNKIKSYVGDDIVIECKKLPKMRQNVFIDSDAGKVKIGRIYDIIGTVDSPFVVAKIFKENKKYIKSYEELINKAVYFEIKNKNDAEKGKKGDGNGEEKESRKINKKLEIRCPECKGGNIITDEQHGEVICENCGFVIEDKLYNFAAEYTAYDSEQRIKKERTGSPLKFSKQLKGLTTEIDRYDRDIRGRSLPTERIAQMHRLRKWHRRTRLSESSERNLSIALNELDRMCSCLNIPGNIKENCAKLYRKALSMGLVKGRSIEVSISAIIYFVSRKHHTPKTLKELAETSGTEKRKIGKTYNFFCKKMKLKVTPAYAADYVHRFACEVGLSGEVEAKAIELLDMAKKIGATAGRSPISIAASVIYFASGLSLKEISEKIPEVGTTTLRNRCNDMAKELGLKLNKEL